MPAVLEKVTAFITRGRDLLLFEHPNAGIQIPAGTVEDGEPLEQAALREAAEESGLPPESLRVAAYLGQSDDPRPGECAYIIRSTTVYARPDPDSFDWVHIRKGIMVQRTGRQADGFTQVSYIETDRAIDPKYVTFQITGWAPDDALCTRLVRHFYRLSFEGTTPDRWTVDIDHHRFTPFWAPVDALPEIIHPQNTWLEFFFAQGH